MTFGWEWILALTAGGVLGVAGRFFWKLCRRLLSPSPGEGFNPSDTIYLEPSRAKEILRDLERKREETLSEIDIKYADRRRDFLAYLDAQREAIIADLRKPKPDPDTPGAGDLITKK
jgi:hypothetical protein